MVGFDLTLTNRVRSDLILVLLWKMWSALTSVFFRRAYSNFFLFRTKKWLMTRRKPREEEFVIDLFGNIICNHLIQLTTDVGRDGSIGIATRYRLDGPGIESRWGERFSAPVQTGPGAHPASYTVGTGSFKGVKRPGCGVDHPSPSSAEVKERVGLYLYSPSSCSWRVLRWTLPLRAPLTSDVFNPRFVVR